MNPPNKHMGKSRNKGNQNARKYQTEEEAKEAHRIIAREWWQKNKDRENAKRRKRKWTNTD